MSIDTSYTLRRDRDQSRFRDLDRVTLKASARTEDGSVIEAGRSGTIVAVWRHGEACASEFADPVGALATVEASDLQLLAPVRR